MLWQRHVHLRLALLASLLACVAPAVVRRAVLRPHAARPCDPEGRGTPPRHHIGCAGDPGEARPLRAEELLLLGRPLDLNSASAAELSLVPGLSGSLGAEIAADRARHGSFGSVDALLRVRGIGPARLARARAHLTVARE